MVITPAAEIIAMPPLAGVVGGTAPEPPQPNIDAFVVAWLVNNQNSIVKSPVPKLTLRFVVTLYQLPSVLFHGRATPHEVDVDKLWTLQYGLK